MRRRRVAVALMPIAMLLVFGLDTVWPRLRWCGRRLAAWPALAGLRRLVAGLPLVAALPLFLVPELCSRLGTAFSAWLLLQGDGWRALAVYAASKLVAGAAALWIYTACAPTFLQNRAFAAVHGAIDRLRRRLLVPVGAKAARTGRVAGLVRYVRRRRRALRLGSDRGANAC